MASCEICGSLDGLLFHDVHICETCKFLFLKKSTRIRVRNAEERDRDNLTVCRMNTMSGTERELYMFAKVKSGTCGVAEFSEWLRIHLIIGMCGPQKV